VPEAKQLIEQGNEQLNAGKIDQAVDLFHQAWLLDPGSVEAIYSLGLASWRRDAAEAEYRASLALMLDPSYVPARKLLSSALFAQGLRREAWGVLDAAPGLDDRAVRLQLLLVDWAQTAFVYEECGPGQYGWAESYLREALKHHCEFATRYAKVDIYDFDPLVADVHHALARVLQRRGKAEEARQHYHLARRIDRTINLNPMYREIMSDADLDNGPSATTR